MNKKYLLLIVKSLIFLSFLTPLILASKTFIFPFVVPKVLFFRSISLLLLGGYILLLVSHWKEYKPKFTYINGAVLFFALSFLISTVVSIDPYRSFWDGHERMLGLFTYLHVFIYYVVITSVIREWRDWQWLMRVFLIAGSIVMLVGIWQRYIDPQALLNRGQNRVSATLGNAIYYSGYGLFLFILGYILAWKETQKSWKIMAIAGSFFGFMGVLLGGSRGTLLGLLAGVAVGITVYALGLKKEQSKVKRSLWSVVVVATLLLATLFFFRQTSVVQKLPGIGRLLTTKVSDITSGTRFMAWSIAVEAWQEYPLFGWGPNNYYYAFNEYYRPEFLEHGWGETWFDNAHNVLVNTLATRGIVGVFAYLVIFVFFVSKLISAHRKGVIDVHIFAGLFAFAVGHFIHNLFVFENPTSLIYFFFFLAYVNHIKLNEKKETSETVPRTVSPGIVGTVGVVVLFLIVVTNINPGKANAQTLDALKKINSGGGVVEAMQIVQSINSPHVDDVRNDTARTTIQILREKKIPTKDIPFVYSALLEMLKKNHELHPLDIRVHIQLAELLQLGGQLFQDSQNMVEAERLLEEARQLSPKRQQVHYMLSAAKLNLKKYDEAEALLRESINYDKKISDGWWRLALIYKQMGKEDQAIQVVQEAEDFGIVFTGQGKEVIDSIR